MATTDDDGGAGVTLDDVMRRLEEIAGSAGAEAEWGSAEYIHRRFGVNHMTLRQLAGVKVRCRKCGDNDIIPVTARVNVVYRVEDVKGWLEREAVVPEWAGRGAT